MGKNISCKEELKVLKEDFEDLKKYLDELREILPISICTLTSFWIIADANKALIELTGYEFLEIVGKSINFIFQEKKAMEKIENDIKNGKKVINKEMTLTTQVQKRVPVSISLAERRDQAGNSVGYFLTITDIAKTKKDQEELEERAEQLENFHRVAVGRELKMVELKEKINKLEKLLKEKAK